MDFGNLFKSKSEIAKEIEKQKFEVQIKTDMKVRQLEKEVQKIDRKAQDDYQRAESCRAAGNRDGAIDAYKSYQNFRKLRNIANKSLLMMQQVTLMVKTGNLTNDVFSLLKTGLETSNFNPGAVQDIIAGNESLKAAYEQVGDMLDVSMDTSTEELSAEAWFNSGTQQNSATASNSTESLNKMRAEFEKIKKG
jgi:hypothetical protein